MRILQVSKYYHPEVGGLEQVVKTLAEGFDGPDHTVRVLAATPRGLGGTERVNDVAVRKVASLGEVASVPVTPLLPLELASASRDADLLHVHLPHPGTVLSHLALGSDSQRVVVTYHSDIVKQSTALRAYEPLLHRFLDRVDHITVTSPNMLAHSRHLEPYADKTSIVPLSIDPDDFGPFDGPKHDQSRPTLLFVGRLSYYKGVEYLVDAMVDVDADLLVVGDGDRREAIERRVREKNLDGDVTLLGRVSDRKLRDCYEEADVFVLPSIAPSEAFGVVQLEAMACGLPVVNTDLPTGVPWVSRDGETGRTVPPEDAAALAGAINDLLDDPSLRRRYGSNAVDRVERHFTRDVMLDRMADIYDAVANDRADDISALPESHTEYQ